MAAFAPQKGSTTANASEGAQFQLLRFGGVGEYVLRSGPFAFGPRMGIAFDHVNADGFGGASSFHRSATWTILAGGGVCTWYPFETFALRLSLEGAIPFTRPSFVALNPPPNGPEVVHRPAPVAGQMGFGAEWHFF
jgi:hypothetical protein